MKEIKEGRIADVIFYNSTNLYSILLFETEEEQFFAVGNMLEPRDGRRCELTGSWTNHPKYGEQFAFSSYRELAPDTAEGIADFLCSGIISGIGPKMAASIVKKFGKDTLTVIEREPERLMEIPGIGKSKLKAITEGYTAHKEFAEVMLGLSKYDLTSLTCMKLYKAFGAKAPDILEENPYALIDEIYGIGFKKADAIAARAGIEKNSHFRICSAVKYMLSNHANAGDCYVPCRIFCEEMADFLDVSREEVAECAFELLIDGAVVKETLDGETVYSLPALSGAEKYAAYKLKLLCTAALTDINADPMQLLENAGRESSVQLSEKQKNAVLLSLSSGVVVITGGPGTGKTTIINTILSIFRSLNFKCMLAAPTGRAAKRMQLAAGAPAFTIHRMLEYSCIEGENRMVFGKNESNPLNTDCLIIDEMSMTDILLAEALLKAIKPGTRLILVGDSDQLPSVGPGNVLKDILASGLIPSIRLTDIFRQAQESTIVVNAYRINHGEYPEFNGRDRDCYFLSRTNDESSAETIKELCSARLPGFFRDIDPYMDIQVLTPTKKGLLGSISLNNMLQEVLNPASPDKKEKNINGRIFRTGDKVMQIKNNYQKEWKNLQTGEEGSGVFNGDIGIVKSLNNDLGKISVLFDDSRFVSYDYIECDELEHSFALTVHKSQGSEFPVVVIPMTGFAPMLSTRNLLYTAITRAAKGAVFVGNQKVCNAMVDNNSIQARYSGLCSRLRDIWERDL